jgi:hypothetical protein
VWPASSRPALRGSEARAPQNAATRTVTRCHARGRYRARSAVAPKRPAPRARRAAVESERTLTAPFAECREPWHSAGGRTRAERRGRTGLRASRQLAGAGETSETSMR